MCYVHHPRPVWTFLHPGRGAVPLIHRPPPHTPHKHAHKNMHTHTNKHTPPPPPPHIHTPPLRLSLHRFASPDLADVYPSSPLNPIISRRVAQPTHPHELGWHDCGEVFCQAVVHPLSPVVHEGGRDTHGGKQVRNGAPMDVCMLLIFTRWANVGTNQRRTKHSFLTGCCVLNPFLSASQLQMLRVA